MSDDLIKRLAEVTAERDALQKSRNRCHNSWELADARAEAAEKALAEVTAKRDGWAALLADAYGADLDWEEVLMDRADQAALASIATIERETLERAAAVCEAVRSESAEHNLPQMALGAMQCREEIRAMIEEKNDE